MEQEWWLFIFVHHSNRAYFITRNTHFNKNNNSPKIFSTYTWILYLYNIIRDKLHSNNYKKKKHFQTALELKGSEGQWKTELSVFLNFFHTPTITFTIFFFFFLYWNWYVPSSNILTNIIYLHGTIKVGCMNIFVSYV